MSDREYDARDYTFVLYYDQHDEVWVAEAEGVDVSQDHPTSLLGALSGLEHKLSARARGGTK